MLLMTWQLSETFWMLSGQRRGFLTGSVSAVRRTEDFYQMTVVWMTHQVSLSHCQEDFGEEKEDLDLYFDPSGHRLRKQPITRQ